jgi:hypothetical protein
MELMVDDGLLEKGCTGPADLRVFTTQSGVD